MEKPWLSNGFLKTQILVLENKPWREHSEYISTMVVIVHFFHSKYYAER